MAPTSIFHLLITLTYIACRVGLQNIPLSFFNLHIVCFSNGGGKDVLSSLHTLCHLILTTTLEKDIILTDGELKTLPENLFNQKNNLLKQILVWQLEKQKITQVLNGYLIFFKLVIKS